MARRRWRHSRGEEVLEDRWGAKPLHPALLEAGLPLLLLLAGCAAPYPMFDKDQDGVPVGADCDDDDSSVGSRYADHDADGHGDGGDPLAGCTAGASAPTGDDCDDAEGAVYPDAPELCDGIDNDCDALIDDADATADALPWYPDQDGDGYGAPDDPLIACDAPPDTADNGEDCDDTDAAVYPGAQELCDGIDDDCNAQIDDGAGSVSSWYPDLDGDGYGAPGDPVLACDAPPDTAGNSDDCDDQNADRHPGVSEQCNGVDDDCDGLRDEGLEGLVSSYVDADGDGYGTGDPVDTCAVSESGLVSARGDCDDADTALHPGADDAAGDALDQDCGGTTGPDPHVGLTESSFSSIQEALDQAADGATIWVGPGTWLERDITYRGRALTLSSTQLAAATTVDVQSSGRGFVFDSGEGADSVLDGFTIANALIGVGGGGGIMMVASSPVIRGCVLRANGAQSGGGMELTAASPTLTGCVFWQNTSSMDGGGVSLKDGSEPTFVRCTFTENVASGAGGGLKVSEGAQPQLFDCTFDQNSAGFGGGVAVSGSSALLDHCDLAGNYAWNDGGGLYLDSSSPVLRNCTLSQNDAQSNGGAASLVDGANPTLENCRLEANSAGIGGGLSISSSTGYLSNCVLEGNAATTGGGLWLSASSPALTSCALVNNAADLGGGLYLAGADSHPSLLNLILAYNSAYNLYAEDPPTSLELYYSDLYVPEGENHNLEALDPSNLTVEPGFLSYEDGAPADLHLALGSFLIDAGDPYSVDPDGTRSDPGVYGGVCADAYDVDGDGIDDCGWNLDADDYFDYFWPGRLADAPAGFDPARYDCDDADALRSACDQG